MQSVFPDHPRATGLACQAWSHLGQPDEALACIAVRRARPSRTTPGSLAAMDELAGQAREALGDDAQALRFYERAGEPLLALRLRHDIPGLEKAATEALAQPPSPFGGAPAYVLARAGLTSEALAVYRHAGTAALLASDQWFKIAVLHEVMQLVALLQNAWPARGGGPSAGASSPCLPRHCTVMERGTPISGSITPRSMRSAGHEDAAIEQISLAVDALDSPFSAGTTETELEFDELSA